MRKTILTSTTLLLFVLAFLGLGGRTQIEIPLAEFEPENYRYAQAETCVNCHQIDNDVMTRAVGVDISSGSPELDERGWLASVHSRSQSHEYRVTTVCAWCHSPTAEGSTQDSLAAAPIETGTWEGVTCGACHPGRLAAEMRGSLLSNFVPGSDPSVQSNYVFRDRSDPTQFNAQCKHCHHEHHEMISAVKAEMLGSGRLRCIDCHMAGYDVDENGVVERFHNMKVESNGPLSCSGTYGTGEGCHANASAEWMRTSIPNIKGPRQEW